LLSEVVGLPACDAKDNMSVVGLEVCARYKSVIWISIALLNDL